MHTSFEFLFDFGGPNAYLAHKILPQICDRTGAQANYVPVLLGGLFKLTNNQAPLIRYAETPAKRTYEMLEFNRFVKVHKLPFRMNKNFPMNTLTLMRGAVAAQHFGCFMPYVDAVMTAMWEDGVDMTDVDLVSGVLNSAGLDAALLLEKAAEAAVKEELVANTENAALRGAFGVPTFFVGDEIYWGKERLGQLEEALTKS